MTILKQSPSKNPRSKGFKVKHFLQICLLLAICFWLLHQVKSSYDGRKAKEGGTASESEVQTERLSMKLGRKGIHFPMQQTALDREGREAEEMKENKPEESKDEGRVGGDDEIDGSDQEKSEEEEPEEAEDLIDEEDREREDETATELESEEAENLLEDERLLENQTQNGSQSSSEAREELEIADGR